MLPYQKRSAQFLTSRIRLTCAYHTSLTFRTNKSGLSPSSLRLIGSKLNLGEFGVIWAHICGPSVHDVDLTSFGILNPRPNEDPEKIVKRHIELLHKYNEAKDATQVRFVFRWKAPLIRNSSRVALTV